MDEEICRRDLPITVGRKPRRFWSVRPLVALPHATGLSHALPADYSDFGLWLNRLNRYAGLQTARNIRLCIPGESRGHIIWAPSNPCWTPIPMLVYYPIESYTDIAIISGRRVAQTRRVGKHNQRAYLLSAPRFSPYRSGQDHADRSLHAFPCRVASVSWRAWASAGSG